MNVKHRSGAYDIVIGSIPEFLASSPDVFVLTDANVAPLWATGFKGGILAVEPGEPSKSIGTFERVVTWLADSKATRSCTLVALGGGVVGDLAGFVAATYMRGMKLVQLPTSLLAMVDSSVGGKVGIDLPQGKNLVGAFYPPDKVLLDLDSLKTLPVREFNNGAAEVWKYGAILDANLLQVLEASPLGPGDSRLPEIVIRCVDLKRGVVEADEFETKGFRATLNFGHTVGHALEQATGYSAMLHGEAIAIGMVVEAAIGEKLGMSPKGAANRLRAGLKTQTLPTVVPAIDESLLINAMRLDKKAQPGALAFALLTGYGSCKLVPDVPESVVLECLRENT
jgi:3-dehydroquinate synthase